jgi:hypothetical protein
VWNSNRIVETDRVKVNTESGNFLSSLKNRNQLEPSTIYFIRIRESNSNDEWSAWSEWHQPFKTEDSQTKVGYWKIIEFDDMMPPLSIKFHTQ